MNFKQKCVAQARKQNRAAIYSEKNNAPFVASFLRALRDVSMKHARAAR